MPRSRIEGLLTSFPKLIPTNSQHTSVETSEVRYVYQPLEELYILLITNKASNILQDIETLHLFARVVSDMCRSADEKEIDRKAFEILGAFDEIVSLGYREQVNLMQVRNVLEMESHEEKIQEIIARVCATHELDHRFAHRGVLFRTRKPRPKKNLNDELNSSRCNDANRRLARRAAGEASRAAISARTSQPTLRFHGSNLPRNLLGGIRNLQRKRTFQ